MDFYRIKQKSTKNGVVEVYPDFRVGRSKDLMVRGGKFYAIWDEAKGLWSQDEYDVQRLVDETLYAHKDSLEGKSEGIVKLKLMGDYSSGSWREFRNFMSHISDSSTQLDESLTFANTEVTKEDFVSRRLPYPLEEGDTAAYDEIMGTLYKPEERAKIEWAIGSIVAGDAKDIQKFIVLYGPPGAGKGTVLNIVMKLFPGYYTTFEAKSLVGSGNNFAMEVFKNNPLVAIQHDGDLSRIEDNTKLNSIISHEEMVMNEKFKSAYSYRINSFLFMGTNKPVRISDAKSGIIRRLIDVQPSGNLIPPSRYHILMSQIDFELGAIAWKCLQVYREMGRNYYSSYRPIEMMMQTDSFYNFVESNYFLFSDQDGVSLSHAWDLYKQYIDEAGIKKEYMMPRHILREELRNYFEEFKPIARIDGKQVRSYYSGFLAGKFVVDERDDDAPYSLSLEESVSLLDDVLADQPAQYANVYETPERKWKDVKTKLSDLDSTQTHYVKLPGDHIVIDFDLKDENGEKSLERNIEAASKWPPTYAELSKSGSGVHLHYIWGGDVDDLARVYDEGIEIKVFTGDSSLRRRLSHCNNTPIATISSGLPLREKRVINPDVVQTEKSLRELVLRNLNKEIHPATKPSIDFISKILEDAYNQGLHYDLSDLRPAVMVFANNSTNQSRECLRIFSNMKFKSEEPSEPREEYKDDELIIFDVEVFPNLFVVSWKKKGKKNKVVSLINPSAADIAELLEFKLVGFNCRRYDNHILYAAYLGYDNQKLFELSQKIINNDMNARFAEAYSVSYADIWDFSTGENRKSLKRHQIELGLGHKELGLPWDEPVPEELWPLVVEYCENDVLTEEGVFDALQGDFKARQILAELSGLTVNDTTQRHTAKIIFGNDKEYKDKFEYTDLSETFPGYEYRFGKSTYRGEDVGEGGYVYSEPGMYTDVVLLDIQSMHPTSIRVLNLFGPYTQRFNELVDARLAIKRKDFDSAREMLGGALAKHLDGDTKSLSNALKIAINIVYGLTSASFDNPFRDNRNVDNIVAKRGALFMIDLKNFIQERGFSVVHIKTDSVKIPGATPELINSIMEFAAEYGYTFEHETTYEKMALVNDAVLVAKVAWSEDESEIGKWKAVGAQYQHPYVFKKLFSGEPIEFKDLCETKSVTTALYLDFNEELPEGDHEYRFVGRAGQFTPVLPGAGGGLLLREKDGSYHAASGTKGYRWLESEMVETNDRHDDIDMSYFNKLVDEGIDNLSKYGDVEWLRS